MAAHPKFLTVYNNGGATLIWPMPGQACIFKAFRASFTLMAAGYVRPADAKGGGHFPLGQGDRASQAVAQTDDLRFPGRQVGFDQLMEQQGAVPGVDVLQHGVIHAYHIHQL